MTDESKSAVISPCGRYRYLLTRAWAPEKGVLTFVMLNPSTADARQDDPTLRKCIHFAREFGFGELWVVNLFAWRSTSPLGLPQEKWQAQGDDNDRYILQAVGASVQVICAWGVHGGRFQRDKEVLALIRQSHSPHCLQLTKGGFPAHPLYLKNDTKARLYYRA